MNRPPRRGHRFALVAENINVLSAIVQDRCYNRFALAAKTRAEVLLFGRLEKPRTFSINRALSLRVYDLANSVNRRVRR